MFLRALHGDRPESIAVGMITPVSPKGKVIGQAKVPHLDGRTLRRIAR